MIYTNHAPHPVGVRIRRKGKEYSKPTLDGTNTDSPKSTTFPFEEVYLRPGDQANFVDVDIVSVINLLKFPSFSPATSGVSYTNQTNEMQNVNYRIDGKLYNQPVQKDSSFNSLTSSSTDYDSIRVGPGQTVILGNVEIVGTSPLQYGIQ